MAKHAAERELADDQRIFEAIGHPVGGNENTNRDWKIVGRSSLIRVGRRRLTVTLP